MILDEFQNLAGYVYPEPYYQTGVIETMPGSFHSIVESKIAPMLVTGSYVGWMIEISEKYLQAGRLTELYMNPYLTSEEGLQAVYKYTEIYNEPVTSEKDTLKALTPEALGALPHELLTGLERASVLGDSDSVESLTDDIRSYNAALADALAVRVADFEFEKILTAIQQTRMENNDSS